MSLATYSVQSTLSKKFKEPLSIYTRYLPITGFKISINTVPPEEFDISLVK